MIGRQSALVVGNSVLGALQGFLSLFIVARYMGAELVGGRAFAFSVVALFGVLCRLGFPITHTRRMARGEDVGASTGTYLALKVVLTSLFALVSLSGAYVWFVLLDKGISDATPEALWLAFASVVTASLRDVPINTFRGMRQIMYREAVLFTNTIVTVLLTVWVAVAYAVGQGRWLPFNDVALWMASTLGVVGPVSFDQALVWLLGAFYAGELAALLLAVAFFLKLRIPMGRPQMEVAREYLVATLPLMLLTTSAVVQKRVSQVMVGFWWDARELGLFAAAAKLSEVLLILAAGVQIVLLPALSRMHAHGDLHRLGHAVLDAERWISFLMWPAVLVVALKPQAILHIAVSDAFLLASPVLVLMGLHSLVASLRMPIQTKALGIGQHQFAGRVAGAAIVANIVLAFVLIPPSLGPIPMFGLGALGAALSALLAAFIPLFAYRRKASEWTGHPFFAMPLRKHLVVAVATWALFRLIDPMLGFPPAAEFRFFHLALYGLLVLACYLALLVPIGGFGRAEVLQMRDVLRGGRA